MMELLHTSLGYFGMVEADSAFTDSFMKSGKILELQKV